MKEWKYNKEQDKLPAAFLLNSIIMGLRWSLAVLGNSGQLLLKKQAVDVEVGAAGN